MKAEAYCQKLLDEMKAKHQDKEEFIQAISEFLSSIVPYLDEHPEVIEQNIIKVLLEPERIIQFRVPWMDDQGKWQVNLGYRAQYNSALGPYKGGIRFHPSVNESIVRFLGFEQIFKNALTSLPIGGGKGGADFDPKGKSEAEIMRFCQSFMTELQKYIGPNTDVPAGDMGVGPREIGYFYGQYKRLNPYEPGVLTGKPVSMWGSYARTEATGYGLLYMVENVLAAEGDSIEGKRVLISGKGNVGYHAAVKARDLGAIVVGISGSSAAIYNEKGIDFDRLKEMVDNRLDFKVMTLAEGTELYEDASIFTIEKPFDIALPCATQNEIDLEIAQNMIHQGVTYVCEGANMPCKDEAVHLFKKENVIFVPAKAANAGGVAVSALEMSQNSQRLQWTFEEVDGHLKEIMADIFELISQTAEQYAEKGDYVSGANIAGCKRVVETMQAQGLV